MSTHLYARTIALTTTVARALDHNAVLFVNPDLPIGSAISIDDDGNLYLLTFGSLAKDSEALADPRIWPKLCKGTYPLYRDFWKVLLSAEEANEPNKKVSPMARSVLTTSARVIRHHSSGIKIRTNAIKSVWELMLL